MSEMMQVPDGWEEKKLGEVVKIAIGGTPDRDNSDYWDSQKISHNLWVSIRDLNKKIIDGTEEYISDLGVLNSNVKKIAKGTILMSFKLSIGKLAFADRDLYTNEAIAALTPNGKLDNLYLYYGLHFWDLLAEVDQAVKGATLNIEKIKKIVIFYPQEKKEQEKIVRIFSTLDKTIEATNSIIEKEKNIKKALMQELLINGIDKDGHIRSPQTHTYKESELGLIPEEWEVDKLNEVTKLMTDFVANGSFESLADNVTVFETPDFAYYVRLVDIRKGLGHEKQTYVDELSFNFLKKSSLIGREILIANIGANVGETFLMPILNKPATIAPNMIVVKVNNKIIPEFLFYFLTFYKGISELQNVTEGSGQPKINKTKLKTINVLIPSIKEQEKIINILTIQDKKIETEETNLAKLKELKKGLMSDLLSGKVRVTV
ncbi:restriction endonuclease subunit S [Sulfurimonas sp.]|uniref:restriction endonuclease subunit S n=1 Tax=Sulfurimonas sp. TaxID=2022749 RepID=UPI00286E4FE8|nr:restriction endonuclease subunit S [Sulfurimonas sp.]